MLDLIETVTNVVAILVFLLLANWWILLALLSWKHVRRIGQIQRAVQRFVGSIERLPCSESDRFEQTPRTSQQIDESNVRSVLDKAISYVDSNRTDLSDVTISLYVNSLRPSSTWFLLQNIATDAGMFFTVVGTSLAFARVASMKSPMDLLVALQLALLTTVAGLSLKVACVLVCTHPVEKSMSAASDLIWEAVSKWGMLPRMTRTASNSPAVFVDTTTGNAVHEKTTTA